MTQPWEADDGLVVAQMTALAGLLWPGRGRWSLPGVVRAAALTAVVAGGALAVAAAAPHGRRLTPRVAPPDDGELLTTGPYAVSRHPIYGALLTTTAGFAVLRRRPEPLVSWAGLAVVLVAKTRAEERRLVERFGDDYLAYRARTPRFLGPRRPPGP